MCNSIGSGCSHFQTQPCCRWTTSYWSFQIMTQLIKRKISHYQNLWVRAERVEDIPLFLVALRVLEVGSWQMRVCLLKHSLSSEVGGRGRVSVCHFGFSWWEPIWFRTTLLESVLFVTGPQLSYKAFCFSKWILWEDFNSSDPRGIGYSAINTLEHEHLSCSNGYLDIVDFFLCKVPAG